MTLSVFFLAEFEEPVLCVLTCKLFVGRVDAGVVGALSFSVGRFLAGLGDSGRDLGSVLLRNMLGPATAAFPGLLFVLLLLARGLDATGECASVPLMYEVG